MTRVLVHDQRIQGRRARLVDPIPAIAEVLEESAKTNHPSLAFGTGHDKALAYGERGQGIIAAALPDEDLVVVWIGEVNKYECGAWEGDQDDPECLRRGLARKVAGLWIDEDAPAGIKNARGAITDERLGEGLFALARRAAAFAASHAPVDWAEWPDLASAWVGMKAKAPWRRADPRSPAASERTLEGGTKGSPRAVFERARTDIVWRARASAAKNPACPPDLIHAFVEDADSRVRQAAISNPSLSLADQWAALPAFSATLVGNKGACAAVRLAATCRLFGLDKDADRSLRAFALREIGKWSSLERADALMGLRERVEALPTGKAKRILSAAANLLKKAGDAAER